MRRLDFSILVITHQIKLEKKRLIFDGVFSQVDGIFDILSIYNTPHDFLELSKTAFKTFLAQLGPILEEWHLMLPPPPTESSRKLGEQE